MRIGTWNIRTLAIPGGCDVLAKELSRYNLDIVVLQETKWPYAGKINTKEYVIYYSGTDNGRYYGGVGYAVKKAISESVIGFTPINERMCNIRLSGRFQNISLISIYAPTEDAEEEEKDAFYGILEEEVNKLPQYDIKIVIGDANAKVGREEIWTEVAGKESLHESTNENGLRLLTFASSANMKICSTMFPRKQIHKATWASPDGKTNNQIYHVLIDNRHFSSVTNVRTIRGAEFGTDHYLVLISLRQRINVNKKKAARKEQMDTEKIKVPEVQREFTIKLTNRFQILEDESIIGTQIAEPNMIEEKWKKLQMVVNDTVKEVCGQKKKMKKNPWFTDECQAAVDKRREVKHKWLESRREENEGQESRELRAEYGEANRNTRLILRRCKRDFLSGKLTKAESDRTTNNTRDLYRTIRFFKTGFSARNYGIKDKNGNLVLDKESGTKVWKDYFEELLNCDLSENRNVEENVNYQHVQPQVLPPSEQDVEEAVKQLKCNKAPGEDGITSDIIKGGGQILVKEIHKLIASAWEKEIVPEEWKEALIIPLHKKGDKQLCSNYRGISLLNTVYKIFSKILLSRLNPYTESIIEEQQTGFMKGRSTIDQVFLLKQVVSKYWEFNKSFCGIFIDFKKAYDSIDRDALFKKMEKHGIPDKLIRLARVCISDSKAKVRVDGEISANFLINTGVRQGDGISPTLFNIAIEGALQKIKNLKRGVKLGIDLNILAFADDVVILSERMGDLSMLAEIFIEECRTVGLELNEEKTKIINFGRNANNRNVEVKIANYSIGCTDSFKYLGVTVNSSNLEDVEIQTKLVNANKCFGACHTLLSSRLLSKCTKIRIYKTIIQPVLMYGSETWILTKRNESRLIVFENKVLRKIFGPINDEGVWRIRKNRELRTLYQDPDIIALIKSNRISWLGHVLRRDEGTRLKEIYQAVPAGRRPLGRPKIRWDDQVREDVTKCGGTADLAEDREAWKRLIYEAKNRLRFVTPQQ